MTRSAARGAATGGLVWFRFRRLTATAVVGVFSRGQRVTIMKARIRHTDSNGDATTEHFRRQINGTVHSFEVDGHVISGDDDAVRALIDGGAAVDPFEDTGSDDAPGMGTGADDLAEAFDGDDE